MSPPPRVLLLGARGRVGREVARALAPWAEVLTAGRAPADHVALDLGRTESVGAALDRAACAVVVNAAGYVAVDRAESEPEAAHALNARAPAALAEACARRGALFVHVGSDYVFDGALGRPCREVDTPRPLGVYGRTKWEGEQAVLRSSGPHLVVRTSWVFARGAEGFLAAFERALAGPGPLRAVEDQRGSPTWARSFAEALATILERLRGVGPRGDLDPGALSGLYHVACAGGASWLELATELKALLRSETPVQGVPRALLPQPAARPPDSRLDCSRLAQVFGVRLPAWQEALRACYASLP